MKKYLIIAGLFLLTLPLFSDVAGPILLFINIPLFSIGQIWILFSEFFYLIFVYKNYFSKIKILKYTFFINLISTLLGVFLFSIIYVLFFGLIGGLFYKININLSYILEAIGTWISGDETKYPNIIFISTIFAFIICYILTVIIEYKLLKRINKKNNIDLKMLNHSIYFNLISYVGLVIGFFGFNNFIK